jgi:RecA-family ATPase
MNLSTMLKNYVAPDYLIKDLFKRGYVYSLTGLTGSGKTVVALYVAMQVARNANIGERAVKGGRVAYFAGENPDDVTQRLMVMTDGLDLATIPFTVMPYAGREQAEIAIAELIHDRQDIALVIVDTSTAYFAGDDENDNKAALEHAKWLRSISRRVPGSPTVLVCCHPIKNAPKIICCHVVAEHS